MLLVETEGSYTLQQYYHTLDIHVGQSLSVLVTTDQNPGSFYMAASPRFMDPVMACVAVLHYTALSSPQSSGPLPEGADPMYYLYSLNQARAIRLNAFLDNINLGECMLKGSLEAYSCKLAGIDRKLSRSLHEVLEEELQEHITELQVELRATQIKLRAVEAKYHNSKKK